MMIASVHLEPNSTFRELRVRFRTIDGHWSSYPDGLGILTGEGGLMWLPKPFSTVIQADPRFFDLSSPHVPENAQPGYTRKVAAAFLDR